MPRSARSHMELGFKEQAVLEYLTYCVSVNADVSEAEAELILKFSTMEIDNGY